MIKIGMIGVSEGNGHPYSFSAIFNGFNEIGMLESGWPNIHSYLKARDNSDFGICGAMVTHIWTQNAEESKIISKAANIENIVNDYMDMMDDVDAIVIARDDWRKHREIATPFLEAGRFVFIDKPLSLNIEDLNYFEPFLKSGQLMSCSGIRYAPELDIIKRDISSFGQMKLIKGTVVKGWEKYAIHMLEGIHGVLPFEFQDIKRNNCGHESFTIETKEGFLLEINCLGIKSPLAMRIEFYSDENYYRADCLDAFSAFKRTMQNFVTMVKGGRSPINYRDTLGLMNIVEKGLSI